MAATDFVKKYLIFPIGGPASILSKFHLLTKSRHCDLSRQADEMFMDKSIGVFLFIIFDFQYWLKPNLCSGSLY